MPIKLIGTIILMVIVALFTGFNLDNRCNIWLFHTFEQVPVYITILGSFVAGVIVTLPFTFKKCPKEKKVKDKKNTQETKTDLAPIQTENQETGA